MNIVRSISEIDAGGLLTVAHDFTELLVRPDNQDIAAEFPGSVARYTGDVDDVYTNLLETQAACTPGIRQQFVAFAGEHAVGFSVVRLVEADQVPEGIDPSWPNLSSFVCNPYRRNGLGGLSLDARLKAVDEQFGGTAWTRVNSYSRQIVISAGFEPVDKDPNAAIYTYRSCV